MIVVSLLHVHVYERVHMHITHSVYVVHAYGPAWECADVYYLGYSVCACLCNMINYDLIAL